MHDLKTLDILELKVGVLIPTYNDSEGLLEAINSVQDEPLRLDIIVIDDGSDSAVELSFKHSIHKIHICRLENNQGIVSALNHGLLKARSLGLEFVARLDCGDLSISPRIFDQSHYLKEHPSVSIIGGVCEFLSTDKSKVLRTWVPPLSSQKISANIVSGPVFCHPAITMRLSTVFDVGMYEKNFKYAEDYQLFYKLLGVSLGANLSQKVCQTVWNPQGLSLANRKKQIRTKIKVQWLFGNKYQWRFWSALGRSIVIWSLPATLRQRYEIFRDQN